MDDQDLERILELRKSVRWSADPRAFDLLREMREARWAIAEIEDSGAVVGMVGAMPFGEVGILCHLAVHNDYRKLSLGVRLSSWAVSYLRSQGAGVTGSTRRARRRDSTALWASSRSTDALCIVWMEEYWRPGYGATGPSTCGCGRCGWRRCCSFGDLPELYGVDRWSFGGTVWP